MSERNWHELRQAISEGPDELAFRAISAILESWTGEGYEEALAHAASSIENWPEECRAAPWSWCLAAVRGERVAAWPLVRSLREEAHRNGCINVIANRWTDPAATRDIVRLDGCRYANYELPVGCDEGTTLATRAQDWPALRHIRRFAPSQAGFDAFLACAIVPRLESLELFLPDNPTACSPVPGFVQSANLLSKLELEFNQNNKDLCFLLSTSRLPSLTELSLKGHWFSDAVPKEMRRLAREPIFAQVRKLRLEELPEEVVLAILARPDLELQSLELGNRAYHGIVQHQEQACRVTANGIATIAKGECIATLTHFSLRNNRVGDIVCTLVQSMEPGRLHTLELINVGLTDAGAAKLAKLPQLSGVTRLNVQENPITARGISALVQSPNLSNLRHLELGSGHNNPYYGGYCQMQAIGDGGASLLAESGIVSQLESLSLRFAGLRAEGLTALSSVRSAPNLRRLDLSENGLHDGLRPLADSELMSALRDLDLSICGLDDDDVGQLCKSDLRNLRKLAIGYNSIGPRATYLACAHTLAGLWRLNLHDNFIGDEGFIALARSPFLGQLLELDLDQDVWNYRKHVLGHEAAQAFTNSSTLSRLDTFIAGIIDEYHGGRSRLPFVRADREIVATSTVLRAPVRQQMSGFEDASDDFQPIEFVYHYNTPREVEGYRRGHDFRGIPPLETTMDEKQWRETCDPGWMLEVLGKSASARKLRLFACACAKRGLELESLENYHAVVRKVESFVDGAASWAECNAQYQFASQGLPGNIDHESLTHQVVYAVGNTVRESPLESARYSAELIVKAFVAKAFKEKPGSIFSDTYLPEHGVQADYLRCIFGIPMRNPVSAGSEPFWTDPAVRDLAQHIYSDGNFSGLPILADALEERGCSDNDMLTHCLAHKLHTRGCWVLDLLLNKK